MNTRMMLLALVLMAAVVACDDVTAPEPQASENAATAPEPQASMNAARAPAGMVPIQIRETAYTPADAVPVLCEPEWAGVSLPSHLNATGTTSHLGRVSAVIAGTGCALDLATGILEISGTAARSAANGDVLLATWTGTLAGGTLTLDVTVTGGTGRFRNATGWVTGGGTMDGATGTGEWTLDGWISQPGH